MGRDVLDFRPFIGTALHNLGIINLLHGDFGAALSFFHRAAENRKACLNEGHVDYIVSFRKSPTICSRLFTGNSHSFNLLSLKTSIVKCAVCQFALNDYARAQSLLEEALDLAKTHRTTLADHCQIAEIQNNLGCLTYMCGESDAAANLFQQSLEVQHAVLNRALYTSSAKLVSQSVSLNTAITRANIGYLKLARNETAIAITSFEASLMVSDGVALPLS